MPLTDFQLELMQLLAANRSEQSHVAGGLVFNAPPDSARYSRDFDFFHDAVEDLVRASELDVLTMQEAGYTVEKIERDQEWSKSASFRKAKVSRDGGFVEIDWAHDSAFRYFPIVEDPVLGWRLHLFDMAVNKALALSSRIETRDYVDMVGLSRRYPLEATVWAACGIDPGFNPLSLLQMIVRFARIDPATLEEVQARKLDPVALKEEWIPVTVQAREEINRVADEQPDLPIGIAFVDQQGEPGWIGNDPALQQHAPSLRGCWPTIRAV